METVVIVTNYDRHLQELRNRLPKIDDTVCRQLAALHPFELVPKNEHDYVKRQSAVRSAVIRNTENGVLYTALIWPGAGTQLVRLYIATPTGEIFLVERPMSAARDFLRLPPPLPRRIMDEIESYIQRGTLQAA